MIVVPPAGDSEYLIYERQSEGWLGSLVEDVRCTSRTGVQAYD
jgi:hypothetical protein